MKRLLSDTDANRGRDTRFQTAVVIGRVSKIECDESHANVRVIMPDRIDRNNTPLISKPVPVLQVLLSAFRDQAFPTVSVTSVRSTFGPA